MAHFCTISSLSQRYAGKLLDHDTGSNFQLHISRTQCKLGKSITGLLIYHDGSNKSVRSSSHEQSVPTCMNKPVNNHVQAGQLNHVQACQQL